MIKPGEFLITQWLFSTAAGNYDIDLAESCAQLQNVADLSMETNMLLDYGPQRGRADGRELVARQYGGTCTADDVMLTFGSQESLYVFYRTFLSAGDHVITTVPGWQQSWEIPRACGCEVSMMPWTPGEPFDAGALADLVRPETRLLVLCSPGNPSGCVLTDEEWSAIVSVLDRTGIWLLSDEEFLTDLSRSAIWKYPRSLSVSSLSKMYGLPGLRLGWAAVSSDEGRQAMAQMVNYKRYISLANSPVCEHLGVGVLADFGNQSERYQGLLASGIDYVTSFADSFRDLVTLVPPQGTPYAWFNLHAPITSMELAQRLLAEHRTLIMPAEVFGTEMGFRFSYARPAEVMEAGVDRFSTLLKEL
ncbi:MAG TPA: pyridoxal phosphate-dependent aminotransferase [Streptosporangiaceae bacterium]|jgi:aspartate/methionine/tyrosine aminotransferase